MKIEIKKKTCFKTFLKNLKIKFFINLGNCCKKYSIYVYCKSFSYPLHYPSHGRKITPESDWSRNVFGILDVFDMFGMLGVFDKSNVHVLIPDVFDMLNIIFVVFGMFVLRVHCSTLSMMFDRYLCLACSVS